MGNFFSWLFSFNDRHYMDGYNYSKNTFGRFMAIAAELTLVAIGLGLWYYMLSLFDTNVLVGILLIIPAFGLVMTAIEYCFCYCFFGFTCATIGALDRFFDKASEKHKKKLAKKKEKEMQKKMELEGDAPIVVDANDVEISQTNVVQEDDVESKKRTKRLKWFDFFVGIFSLLLAIGTIIGAFYMFISKIGS